MTWKFPRSSRRSNSGQRKPLTNLRDDDVYSGLLEAIREHGSGRRILYAPNVGNWGDGLIHQGTVQFLSENGIEYTQVNRSKFLQIRKAFHGTGLRLENTLLIAGGGGAFCQAWALSRDFVKANMPLVDHTILLPTSFELPPLEVDSALLTYFARDRHNSQLNNPTSEFCHDMAFYLQLDSLTVEPTIEEGNFFRDDKERHDDARMPLENLDLSALGNHLQPAQPFFQILASYKKINTDRMHVAIAGSLLGRDVVLYPGNYFKSADVFHSSIQPNFVSTELRRWK